ncbi:MAG: hypothetical protein GF320_11100 [Armatimonadia bacterium]|nr:hypothetical protein [Armatimonadia bacterium]
MRQYGLLVLLAVTLTLCIAGCMRTQGEAQITINPIATDQPPVAAADVPAEPRDEEPMLPPGETVRIHLQDQASLEEGGPAPADVSFVEKPTLADIPDGPMRGVIHGQPVEIQSVFIEPDIDDKGWSFTFSSAAAEGPTDIIDLEREVNLDIDQAPAPGYTFTKGLEDGVEFEDFHAYYVYPQADGSPYSINSPWSCAIEIESAEIAPYDPGGDTFQAAGTVKGRALICSRHEGFETGAVTLTYVGGEFEAIARYMGAP